MSYGRRHRQTNSALPESNMLLAASRRYVDARGTIHAFYNDLSVEEETPNTLQYEDRHDQSRADNDKQ